MTKVVIFDLYGTLITSKEGLESRDEALSRILREAGHEVYYQEVWAARQFVSFIDYPKGRANSPHEYYAKVLERLEIKPTTALINGLAAKDLELDNTMLYPDVVPTMSELRKRKVKTSIVTTIAAWRFEPLIKQHNVLIDFVCTAREAHAVKPNPQSFTTVLNRFGVKAAEAMTVGDDIKTDIEPAKKLGIETVLICRTKKAESQIADHVILSLNELLNLL